MSFDDIKDGYTQCKIKGNLYKIAYDFHAIGKLQETYNSGFFNLVSVLDDLKVKKLEDILTFCYIGFLKYQPDFKIEELYDYGFFGALYTMCGAEFVRAVKLPDEYEKMVYEGKEAEGKNKVAIKKKSVLSRLLTIFIKH